MGHVNTARVSQENMALSRQVERLTIELEEAGARAAEQVARVDALLELHLSAAGHLKAPGEDGGS